MNPVSWLRLTWVGARAGRLQPALVCSFVAGCACDDCVHHGQGVKCVGRAPFLTLHCSLWNSRENLDTLKGLVAVQQHHRHLPGDHFWVLRSVPPPALHSSHLTLVSAVPEPRVGFRVTDWLAAGKSFIPLSDPVLSFISTSGRWWYCFLHEGFLGKNLKTPECFVIIALLATRK